jgi:hypothetical protein
MIEHNITYSSTKRKILTDSENIIDFCKLNNVEIKVNHINDKEFNFTVLGSGNNLTNLQNYINDIKNEKVLDENNNKIYLFLIKFLFFIPYVFLSLIVVIPFILYFFKTKKLLTLPIQNLIELDYV